MMAPGRDRHLMIGFGCVVFLLIARLFVIQILDDRYKIDADNNSMVFDLIYPTRGIIYDRNGKILVGNKVAYDLLVTPREVEAFDTTLLAGVLDCSEDFIREKMAEYHRNRRQIGYRSVVMIRRLKQETYMKFAEVRYRFPGFKGQVRSIRDYPINAGGNLLGYVSEVDADYIERHGREYRAGDYAGMTGIEAAMEKELRGEKGYHLYLRNSRNQIEGPYRDGNMDREAVPGRDVVTTIDADLQQYGQELMRRKAGSLVAIEPATGEILAMVSSPGIDVKMLGDIGRYYADIVQDPCKPMFNRAVQAPYPPGSVFKLVNGLIGLEEGVITPETVFPCNRGYVYGNRKLGCHAHRSPLDLEDAVMTSCNAYFCHVLKNVLENERYSGIDAALTKWREYAESFGFGKPLGSDFPAESGGTLPSARYYNRIYGKGRWKFSTILSISIGQGEIGATPLQMANLCATIANRGYYVIPHLIREAGRLPTASKYQKRHHTMVDPSHFETAVSGMWKAVNSGYGSGGTASVAAVKGLDLCGKTGTAQNPHGADNSIFICFAPRENPKIAVAAYVENAGFGAAWAAPIGSLLAEKYLHGEISPERKALEKRIMEGALLSRTVKR